MPHALFHKTLMLIETQQIAEARLFVEKTAQKVSAGKLPPYRNLIIEIYIALEEENEDEIARAYRELLRILKNPNIGAYDFVSIIFTVGARLAYYKRIDKALELLTLGIPKGIILSYDELTINPAYDSLRGEQQFKDLLAQSLKLAKEGAAVLQNARAKTGFPAHLEEPFDQFIERLGLQ